MASQPRWTLTPCVRTSGVDNDCVFGENSRALAIPKPLLAQMWTQVYEGKRALKRFGLEVGGEREAKAVAALNHSNICQLYDVGPNYLVMEYIEGTPLKGPLPVDTARQPIPERLERISPEPRLGNQISISSNTHASP